MVCEAMLVRGLFLGVSTALLLGCGFDPLARCAGRDVSAGDSLECPVPQWDDRSFQLQLPDSWDGSSPLPLVVAFHGGGGNRKSANSVTCPGGHTGNAGCLAKIARRRGYAVVLPDGTGTRPLRAVRTWNAGGGQDGWNCTSGGACRSGVDDEAYFDDLLAEVRRTVPVDRRRIHATGLSNGGAMAHRVACARSDVLASIVSVGSGNQYAAAGGDCAGGVAVLQIHGTDDPCWTYETSSESCLDDHGGDKIGAEESAESWRQRNGCDAMAEEDVPLDVRDAADPTRAYRRSYAGCAADVELIRLEGAGHTWPGGDQYLKVSRIGRVSRQIDSELIVEFMDAHPRP